ncbi:hypothetical protein M1D52_04280 [Olivibacter sp. SA151]|uniref:pectate lyase family protein n=1 Tax=Olivibacter jilunii TaxID=985016 RepID=UPI003F174F33
MMKTILLQKNRWLAGFLGMAALLGACSKLPQSDNNHPYMENGRVIAFPGAEGFGRFAQGARGAANPSVYIVTNLNDNGPGSFRDAVSQPGRFVVFAVSGIIRLQSNLSVAANTTIAGQTAPGKGVVLYGRKVTFTGANNSITRYMRIRLGVNGGASRNDDASGVANGKNMIFDHVSFSWGQDEVFSINWDNKGNEPDSITIQNSIIGQGLHRHNHSAGGLIQTVNGKISMLKNLYHSNKTRNPKVKGYNEFVNNVVYNYGNLDNPMGHTVSGDAYIMGGSAGISEVNILNNYFISGPLTPPKNTPFSRGTGTFYLHAAGNYFDPNKNGVLDGSLVPFDTIGYPGLADSNFVQQPFAYPAKTPSMNAEQAYHYVLNNAGATLPSRDEVDLSMINELRSKGKQGSYIYTESDLALPNDGLGSFPEATALKDTDLDGIPDVWEQRLGLNANDATDALQTNTSFPQYLNIEVYINALTPTSR